jgi:hypothetical protein
MTLRRCRSLCEERIWRISSSTTAPLYFAAVPSLVPLSTDEVLGGRHFQQLYASLQQPALSLADSAVQHFRQRGRGPGRLWNLLTPTTLAAPFQVASMYRHTSQIPTITTLNTGEEDALTCADRLTAPPFHGHCPRRQAGATMPRNTKRLQEMEDACSLPLVSVYVRDGTPRLEQSARVDPGIAKCHAHVSSRSKR